MQSENHKEEVPFAYYEEEFRSIDPEEVTARLPYVGWNGKWFTVRLLGRELRISWPEYAMEAADGEALPPLPTQTFLLRCLIGGRDESWGGKWVTFREMPWGEVYLTPYTGRVLRRAAFTFGTRLADFRSACEKLGATPILHGDAGFEFELIGPYRMQILVWEGDEEFPPSAQVIYTDNFAPGFAAEDRVVAGDILISHIRAAM